MRARIAGLSAAVLGGLALVLAVLLASGSPVPEAGLPLGESYETVAEGADVTFLDPVTLEQRTGEDVQVQVEVSGDPGSVDADEGTAVRIAETTTTAADGTLIATTSSTTACLDRRTAEAVDCATEAVDGRQTDVRGLVLGFPPGTRAQDRMMWDGTVQASFPVRYLGTERFRGLEVQRYEQVVPEQVVRPVTVPGALLGSAGGPASGDLVHGATRTLLVEPVSGVVVSAEEQVLTRLRATDGTPGAVLLGGELGTSEESVTDAIARAREASDRQDPPGAVAPWVLGGAGLVLLGTGGLLVARGRQRPARPAEDEADRPLVPAS